MTRKTLDAMAAGGMYDVVGGGFHRYSVDERWLVPHFEKMLYDNALLVPAYLHGWLVLGEDGYRRVAEETVDYVLRELRLEGGGLASAQDADTDGVEGLTYTWTAEELDGLPATLEPFEQGRSIVRRARRGDAAAPARAARTSAAAAARRQGDRGVERARARGARRGGAEARAPGRRRGARELGEFLLGPLSDGDRLHRTWRNGVAKGTGYLEDYACVAHGLYELHVATGELRWLQESLRLAQLAVDLFADDERGGFFHTPGDGEELVARKKELDDNPTPSGNSMLAYVLLRLARIYGDDELERRAVSVFRLALPSVTRVPSAFGWLLCALDLHFSPRRELAIVAPAGSELARAALRPFDPGTVVAFGPSDEVPLLAGKGLSTGGPRLRVRELRVPGAGDRCRRPRALGVEPLEAARLGLEPLAEIGLEARDVGAQPDELVVEPALLVADVVVGLPAGDAGAALRNRRCTAVAERRTWAFNAADVVDPVTRLVGSTPCRAASRRR